MKTDYRRELKGLSLEILKHRREKLLDTLLNEITFDYSTGRTANMLSYVESLIKKITDKQN